MKATKLTAFITGFVLACFGVMLEPYYQLPAVCMVPIFFISMVTFVAGIDYIKESLRLQKTFTRHTTRKECGEILSAILKPVTFRIFMCFLGSILGMFAGISIVFLIDPSAQIG